MAEAVPHLAIIGPGRAGLALGSLLLEVSAVGRLSYAGRHPTPPDHPLFRGAPTPATYHPMSALGALARQAPDAVVIAVPDAAILSVAEQLAQTDLPSSTPVLHLSGVLGADALSPLALRGIPTGSLHPLATLADTRAAANLRGAWFAVEGDEAAGQFAHRLVAAMEGRPLQLDAERKALYHAGAVAASNFVVALLGVAERWMGAAGVPAEAARPALAALAAGAVENVRRVGPVEALTGPVSRGDADTVRRHLARLSPSDRPLYSVLASTTLTLARQRGLDPVAAAEIERLLEPIE